MNKLGLYFTIGIPIFCVILLLRFSGLIGNPAFLIINTIFIFFLHVLRKNYKSISNYKHSSTIGCDSLKSCAPVEVLTRQNNLRTRNRKLGDIGMGEQEKLKIFDDNKNLLGLATRSDVHRIGYWHEAFHCWFISKEQGINYIYLQLRSKNKKDYPNLLDITAAGHLLADETVEDGVREIKEEIGIDVAFKELVKLGVIDYCVVQEGLLQKENG